MTDKVAGPDGSVSSEVLGPLLAEANMDALKAVAHQAGLDGIDLHALARVLDAAQRIAAADERQRCAAYLAKQARLLLPANGVARAKLESCAAVLGLGLVEWA